MAYLLAGDIISGQEASAKITVKNKDGSTTIEDAFFSKQIEAKCEIKKNPVRTLGKRADQQKPNGWTGTGSMTIYYITSLFRKMAIQYIKTGVPVYFDLLITNEDPGSSVGPQTMVIKNCSLNSLLLAKIDVDADTLDEAVEFTFDDADILDEFGVPILAG